MQLWMWHQYSVTLWQTLGQNRASSNIDIGTFLVNLNTLLWQMNGPQHTLNWLGLFPAWCQFLGKQFRVSGYLVIWGSGFVRAYTENLVDQFHLPINRLSPVMIMTQSKWHRPLTLADTADWKSYHYKFKMWRQHRWSTWQNVKQITN